MSNEKSFSLREKIAVAASAAIVLATVIYWIVQVRGVMEMLELAYG